MCRVVREERVQRTQADDVGTALGHDADQLRQVAEVADAPVVLRAQRIELHSRAPDAAIALQRGRSMALLWRADHEGRRAHVGIGVLDGSTMRGGVALYAEAVITRGKTQRHRQATFVPACAIELGIGAFGQGARIDVAAVHRAAFFFELPTYVVRGRRQAQRDGPFR